MEVRNEKPPNDNKSEKRGGVGRTEEEGEEETIDSAGVRYRTFSEPPPAESRLRVDK